MIFLNSEFDKNYLRELPELPGCYRFMNISGEIIYIGKAVNLRKRVSSYFQHRDNLDERSKALRGKISSFDYIICGSEKEALLLESNLIKKYSPKYNINLKDGSSYGYIEITKEKFPRIVSIRGRDPQKELYGPFTSSESRVYLQRYINKIFKLRTCKKLKKKRCLRYQMGNCSAPCENLISHGQYLEDVESARTALRGKSKDLVANMTKKMKELAQQEEFEKAIEMRKRIEGLKYLKIEQLVERRTQRNEDIINYIINEDMVYLMVFSVKRGVLCDKEEFSFGYCEDFFSQFLLHFYSERHLPSEIILPQMPCKDVISLLQDKVKFKIKFTVPLKGDKKKFLELIAGNIEDRYFKHIIALKSLRKSLSLQKNPYKIECFDISHLQGNETVASMVSFNNGLPYKKGYRRFKIKEVQGIDDFASMEEVVQRRYQRLLEEDGIFPDLIILDGGLGQLNAGLKVLRKSLGLKIPMISIAKRNEEIYLENSLAPVVLEKKDNGLQLIQRIRDEAHRFAITYNRKLRSKKFIPEVIQK